MVQEGGDWMSENEIFLPSNFPIEDGLTLPNGGQFTSFWPSLIQEARRSG
jgi:hypothetical protein